MVEWGWQSGRVGVAEWDLPSGRVLVFIILYNFIQMLH